MNNRLLRNLGITSAALGAGAAAVWTGELYKYTFCRDIGLFKYLPPKKTHEQDYYDHRDSTAQKMREDKSCLEMSIVNADGETLRGFYYPCGDRPGKKLLFMIHGYRSEHAETAGMYLDFYRERGFDLFCCDHAGHGISDGGKIGWDVTESRDCLKWLDHLIALCGEDVQIVLHGFSMGGATVLKMSDRCPGQVKFIISDSGYSDVERLLRVSLKRMYTPLRLVNCVVGGYDMNESDVRAHLLRTDKPILFIHGRLDPTVPFYMGEELYALCPTEKDCLFTDDAKHIETMHLHPQEYAEKVDKFVEMFIS